MKRFGSIFPFMEAGAQARHIGRLVANHDFVKALLTYGSFDEYVFSNTSLSNLSMFAAAMKTWGLPDDRLSRVRCVGYAELPALLGSRAFHVFHLGGWGRLAAGLHYIRSQHASNPWPITAVTHSLHSRDVVEHAVRLSHAGFATYDAIFCTSTDGREALRRLLEGAAPIAGRSYAGRLEHLPLGIDDRLVDTTGDRARCRRRLLIDDDAFVLLTLGRMTSFQKMDLGPLLRAFAHRIVPASPRPIVLLLAGSATPDDIRQIKHDVNRCGIEASVRLYANFPEDQKPDVLAAADVLVSPVDNTQETFGLSLLEAMAAGLPVVASRFDGYKDLVNDGVDGFLVETYGSTTDPIAEWFDVTDANVAQLYQSQGVAVNTDQLVDRVLQLAHDDGRRGEMGRAGRAKIDREYRWSRVIGRYEEAWDRLSADARTAGIPATGRNPYDLGSGRIFSHYPSRLLTLDDRIAATGHVVDVRPYNETLTLLEAALLDGVVRRATESGPDGARAADLVAAAGVPEPQAWFAVLWLVKYGALRVL
jgi:glycosyltransferase involved in cell wall biosynthesis